MSALVGSLRIDLGLNSATFQEGLRRSQSQLDRSQKRFQAVARGMSSVFAPLLTALSAGGLAASAGAFLDIADRARTMEATLRLATAASGDFSTAQEDVRRIANETRTGIEETSTLYASFQRNAQELGITQQEAARATQTVSEAFQISGASAAEAAGGLRQFMQGIQSGTLRGEELNSVLENAPRLARLLADSLGVTIGQLRAMGAEGELTADKLLRALTDRRFTAQIDAEFRQLPVTFGQAMTLVRNAAITTIGAFDRGGQFSQALANFASQGSDTFSGLARDAERAGAEVRAAFDGLGTLFNPMADNATNVFGLISRLARSVSADIRAGTRALDDLTGNYWRFGVAQTAAIRRRMSEDQNYIPPAGFVDRARTAASVEATSLRARTQNAGIGAAWRDNVRGPRSAAPSPRALPAGGGSSSRRSSGGGGGGRAAPARIELGAPGYEFDVRNTAQMLRDFEAARAELAAINGDTPVELITTPEQTQQLVDSIMTMGEGLEALKLPDLSQMLPVEDQERILNFVDGFRRDLSAGLADAIVAGKNLGDALVDTFKRAAAALLESSILQLLTGTGFGGKGGLGGVVGFFATALGALFGGGLAEGGPARRGKAYIVGEEGPEWFLPDQSGTVIPHDLTAKLTALLMPGPPRMAATAMPRLALPGLPGDGPRASSPSAVPFNALPGFAKGGSFEVGGPPGIDRSVLSLNGAAIARVSRGETVNVGRGDGGLVINQTFAPNFAGNAATKEDMVTFAAVVKADVLGAIRQANRRRG